jgi:hypothetical protein
MKNTIKILLALLCVSSMSTGLLSMQFDAYTTRRKNGIDQKLINLIAELEPKRSERFQAAINTLGRSNLTSREGRMNPDIKQAYLIDAEIQMIWQATRAFEELLANRAGINAAAQTMQNWLDEIPGREKPSRKTLRSIFAVSPFSH